jgi:hypothetical protein
MAGETNSSTIFAWVLAEMIFNFWGGSFGSKHEIIHHFIVNLQKQSVDFNNKPENFLRLVYSVMEYCGGYRSDILISGLANRHIQPGH